MSALQRRVVRGAGLVLIAVVLMLAAGYLLLPLAVRMAIGGLDLAMSGTIWLVASANAGASATTILMTIGRAALRVFTSTRAVAILSGLVLLGAAALYGLQRLLGLEEEEESPR